MELALAQVKAEVKAEDMGDGDAISSPAGLCLTPSPYVTKSESDFVT